jgi:hypothetical protein
MSNQVNTINCAGNVGNTGIEACFFDPKNIIGAIITPYGYKLTAAEVAAGPQVQLAQDAMNDNKLDRVFPAGNFVDTKDSSDAPKMQTFGYGLKFTIIEGSLDWQYQFVKGGVQLHKQFRTFNGGNFGTYFYTVQPGGQNALIGTQILESDGTYSIGSIPMTEIWTDPWKPNTGAATAAYLINFRFLPKYINDQLAFVLTDADLAETINGLVDVKLSGVASSTSGSYTLSAATAGAGTNMYALYATELAEVSLVTALNPATGLPIAIATVTQNPTAQGWTVSLTKTDPNYPAAGGKVTFIVSGPTELSVAGIEGYDFGTTGVTVTSN